MIPAVPPRMMNPCRRRSQTNDTIITSEMEEVLVKGQCDEDLKSMLRSVSKMFFDDFKEELKPRTGQMKIQIEEDVRHQEHAAKRCGI